MSSVVTHTHEISMRWADLDPLLHANNVAYLDYAAESRAVIADLDLIEPEDNIDRIAIRYTGAIMFTRLPIYVVSTLGAAHLTQQIYTGTSDGRDRVVFAHIDTHYGKRRGSAPRVDTPMLLSRVRRSDLDATGAVSLTKTFELFQETRLLELSKQHDASLATSFVVGSNDVTFRRALPWRDQPYTANMWIARIERASLDVRSQLYDDDGIFAESTTVVIGFDTSTQKSRPFTGQERAQLETYLRT